MKTHFIALITCLSLVGCKTYIPTDEYGNIINTDKFASDYSDPVNTEEKGTLKTVNKNTVLACNYSSFENARQDAYAYALDFDSIQKIKSNTKTYCQKNSSNKGCLHELNINSVMSDKKLVNTIKKGDCYKFTFKKMKGFKNVDASESYSSFDRPSVNESLIRINFVNVNTPVRAKLNGKPITLSQDKPFNIKGKKVMNFEIIDSRFKYKRFTINVPKESKYITKNVALVQVYKKRKKNKEVGAGFERQDYKVLNSKTSERVVVLRNRHDVDPSNDHLTNLHSEVVFKIYTNFERFVERGIEKPMSSIAVLTNLHEPHYSYFGFKPKEQNAENDYGRVTLQITVYLENMFKFAQYNLHYEVIKKNGIAYIKDSFGGPHSSWYYDTGYSFGNGIGAGLSYNYGSDCIVTLDGSNKPISKIEVKFIKGWYMWW